ncbi:hypothetical protein [Mesorhizobium sp. M0909]|uniref:hypothetical protein n=1 Tax=Mesorhizobium sp. M0909 TaxID=2957024 RepID=UPI00333BAC35
MDLTEILSAILNPGGMQGAAAQSVGFPSQGVSDHNNPALLRQAQQGFAPQMPQQAPQQQAMPPQAQMRPATPPQLRQGAPAPENSPRPATAPASGGFGGLGDFLQNIIAPNRAAQNVTAKWLQSQGLDPGTATVLASDKSALRSYIVQRSKSQEPNEYDQRAAVAAQYNLDPTTPEGRNYILTGKLGGDENKPTSDIQNFQFAKQNGYRGSFEQWTKDNKGGINVNLPGAPNIGTIPPGYAAKQDPTTGAWTMQPIPGGPADESSANAAKGENAATATDVITGAAHKIRTLAKEPGATGLVGAGASYIPNTPAAEVYRQVDVLKSNATVENLNAMRAQSKTGGALGSVTEKEGAMLAAKSGALDPKSPYFQDQLDDYERTLLRVVHGKSAGDQIFDATRQRSDAGPSRVNNPNPPSAIPGGGKYRNRAVNRQTGETIEWDGSNWVPVQ